MASLKPRDSTGKISIKALTKEKFLHEVTQSRISSIDSFPFNKSRCRILSKNDKIAEGTKGILYWMSRDCRVQDNWALLFAQRLALKNKLPLIVIFSLFEAHLQYPTRRHQHFLLEGLKHVDNECHSLNIQFCLVNESPKDLAETIERNKLGGVVCDFSPLRKHQESKQTLMKSLPKSIPLVQVDAHNIVPTWLASDKQEHMARTLRPKIKSKLSEYLSGFPEVARHPYSWKINLNAVKFAAKTLWDVEALPDIEASEVAGLQRLHSFLQQGLEHYGITSNDPSKEHTSNLSFWINFGFISAQRVALEVKSLEALFKEQVDKYLEELIIRRELAENYCFYNANYDNIKGASDWAQKTLAAHQTDKRTYTYSRDQLQNALTHDDMWNAAQLQLLKEGKIHGYIRMYWCKKILEWTKSPQEALEFALWLNDTFALDGNDPNGFVGVMWSICGVHDQGWKERQVFGKIRFMVDYSLRRKFDMDAYCARFGVAATNSGSKRGLKRKVKK